MAFEPSNPLEESMLRASKDAAHRPQFYKDFLSAPIFVIQAGPVPEKAGMTKLEAGQTVSFPNMEKNGKSYIPIFTSLQELRRALKSEAAYLSLNAREFLTLTKGADLLLNPMSELGKEFPKEEVAALLDGSMWQPESRIVVDKPQQVMIGQPKDYPTELVEALSRYFKKESRVKRAYVAHYFNPATGEPPHTLVGIEASGDWDSVIGGIGVVAKGVMVPNPPIDFMPLTGDEGVQGYLKKLKPFYERKFLGLF